MSLKSFLFGSKEKINNVPVLNKGQRRFMDQLLQQTGPSVSRGVSRAFGEGQNPLEKAYQQSRLNAIPFYENLERNPYEAAMQNNPWLQQSLNSFQPQQQMPLDLIFPSEISAYQQAQQPGMGGYEGAIFDVINRYAPGVLDKYLQSKGWIKPPEAPKAEPQASQTKAQPVKKAQATQKVAQKKAQQARVRELLARRPPHHHGSRCSGGSCRRR